MMTFRRSSRTLACLALCATVLALLTLDRPLPATEVDALAGGGALIDAVLDPERPTESRLRDGFQVGADHPRASNFTKKRRTWRRHLVDAPLPRWTAGLAALLAPSSLSDRHAAHALACLLMALVALGAMTLLGGGAAGLSAALATLASTAALDAAGGAGASAVAAAAMMAFLISTQRLLSRRGGATPVGLSWGLLLACHPGALFLLVPLFVAVAIAWRSESPRPAERFDDASTLSLPPIPIALLGAPVIGLLVLIALWPTLWSDTGRGLGEWLTGTWWTVAPTQTAMGQTYHSPGGRAPQAFLATLQWLVWTPWPLFIAWLAGLLTTVRAGRAGLWLPVLVLATTLLIGGIDGGLFGARRSLMPWLWVCTALTAGIGLAHLGRHLGPTIAGLCVLWALVAQPWGVEAVGPEARLPTPTAQLEHIADAQPNARVHIASRNTGQRYGVETLAWRAGLALQWAKAAKAEWVIALGPSDDDGAWWAEREPEWRGQIAGVEARRYRR
jgi:hypothetical protein